MGIVGIVAAAFVWSASDLKLSFIEDETLVATLESCVRAFEMSFPSLMRFSSIFATALFPSRNVFATISPNGGGMTRIYDSVAAAKSLRLREIIAKTGHTIKPNTAAIPIPNIDA